MGDINWGMVEKILLSEKAKNKIVRKSVFSGQVGKEFVAGKKLCLNINMVLVWKRYWMSGLGFY